MYRYDANNLYLQEARVCGARPKLVQTLLCPKRTKGRPMNGAIAQVSIALVSQGDTENVTESVTAAASVIHELRHGGSFS